MKASLSEIKKISTTLNTIGKNVKLWQSMAGASG
jgi:hypothetical protein